MEAIPIDKISGHLVCGAVLGMACYSAYHIFRGALDENYMIKNKDYWYQKIIGFGAIGAFLVVGHKDK